MLGTIVTALFQVILILVVVGGMIGFFIWIVFKMIDNTIEMEVEREEAFVDVCRDFGFELDPFGMRHLPFNLEQFEFFYTGLSRGVKNVYLSTRDDLSMALFDYTYRIHKPDSLAPSLETYTVLWIGSDELRVPDVNLLPSRFRYRSAGNRARKSENEKDKPSSAKPLMDSFRQRWERKWISLETIGRRDFDEKYHVRIYSPEAVPKVLSEEVMNFFIERPELAWEAHGGHFILFDPAIKRIIQKENLAALVTTGITLFGFFTECEADKEMLQAAGTVEEK